MKMLLVTGSGELSGFSGRLESILRRNIEEHIDIINVGAAGKTGTGDPVGAAGATGTGDTAETTDNTDTTGLAVPKATTDTTGSTDHTNLEDTANAGATADSVGPADSRGATVSTDPMDSTGPTGPADTVEAQVREAVQKECPDIVVFDTADDALTGITLQLLGEFKALDEDMQLLVLLERVDNTVDKTGDKNTDNILEEMLEHGADHFLFKPFNEAELAAQVKTAVKTRRKIKALREKEKVMTLALKEKGAAIKQNKKKKGIPLEAAQAASPQTAREPPRDTDQDTVSAINKLLSLSLQDTSLEKLLEEAIQLILAIPWLVFRETGSIFLLENKHLLLKAQKGLEEPVREKCARLPLGRCLCGRAVLTGEIQFSAGIDERHQIYFEGMEPHGHYCIPIKTPQKINGVLNIYLHEGHQRSEKEEQFLTAVADTLAGIIERKQVEKMLAKNAEKQALLLDNIETQIWYLQDIKTYGVVNKAHADFMGVKKEELDNKSLYDFLDPEEVGICMAGNKEVFQAKQQIRTEEWIANGRGEKRLLAITKTPKLDHNNNVEYVVCSAEDITERRQMENALRESEATLRRIADNMQDLISQTDAKGVFQYVSPSYKQVLGYEQKELLGRSAFDFIHPEDRGKIAAAFEKGVREKEADRAEYRFRHAEGHYIWMETVGKLVQDDSGNMTGAVFSSRDISKRKKAEEELRKAHDELEIKVRERTAELSRANNLLKAEIEERKKVEEAVKESENKYRRLIEALQEGIWSIDESGYTTYVNEPMASMLGYTAEEMHGRHLFEFIDEEGIEIARYYLQRRAQGIKEQHEFEFVKKDGSRVYAIIEASPIFDGKGYIGAVAGVLDITERKQAEKEAAFLLNTALAISEVEDFHSAMAVTIRNICETTGWACGEGWLYDPARNTLICSPAWYAGVEGLESFRAISEELSFERGAGLPGKVWEAKKPLWIQDIMRDVDPKRTNHLQEAGFRGAVGIPILAGEEVAAVITFFTFEPRQEDEHFVELVAGVASQLEGVFRRKKAEDELRESERLLAHTLNASPVIIYRLEADLTATWISENITRILGYTVEEALRPEWWVDNLHPGDREEAVAQSDHVLSENKAVLYYRFLKKDGEPIWMRDELSLIRDGDGNPVGIIGVWMDITEQKRAEGERIAREAAEQANQAKSDFLANMSHELRTPLNSILGFSEVMQDELGGALNEKQKEYVDNIYSSGKHLLSLINDILDLSKVEAGKMELEIGEVELPQLVQVSLTMLAEKAFKKNLTLKEEIAPGLPSRIRADERKLKQILFNLLSNAVKFTPEGGLVTVRVSRREDSCGPGLEGGRPDPQISGLSSQGGELYSQGGGADCRSGDPESRNGGSGPHSSRSGGPDPQSGRPDPQSGDYLGYLQVEVEDTGIGISLEDQGKIFQEFCQVEAPLTKQHEGAGLGLALCRHLVNLHGGHIWFKSEKGSGSSFYFTIPLEKT